MFAEMIEDYDWESDESEDWESDEAFAEADEADEGAEDIGERAWRRRRSRRSHLRGVRPFKPIGGVKGITVRGPDGRARNLPFPTKLATAAQTNQGLAKQELDRRALAGRVTDLEARRRKDLKNAGQATSLASLAMIGGLSGYAAFRAMEKPSGTRLKAWVEQTPTTMATAAAAAQLIGSGASYLFTGGYHGGGIRIAADAASAVQIAAYAFGSFHKPEEPEKVRALGTREEANKDMFETKPPAKTLYLIENDDSTGEQDLFLRVIYDQNNKARLMPVN